MRRIAIQDANILIDLVKTGLFDYCMKLEYRFITTDFVFDELYEEQQKQVAPYITEGRFVIISISDLALQEITRLNQEDNRLSPQDCSALHFAIENNYILLTGDKRMRTMANKKTIEYYGIFWIIDLLVEGAILNKNEALAFLEKLQLVNRRLPAEEFEKRRNSWK
jgi:rRNA-processing protein FCF1